MSGIAPTIDSPESTQLTISNLPFNCSWTQLRDLFQEKVGDVAYVEIFKDGTGKSRGSGKVHFENPEAKKMALSVMDTYELNGRKLQLRIARRNYLSRRQQPYVSKQRGEPENYNTYGLSLQFLESINIQPPLVNKVFVANLDYKADRAKIKEIFKMAGKVRNIDLAVDKDCNSRGFALVEYDHPLEAVQAISMFDKQTLYERKINVKMARGEKEKSEVKLPDGLKGIGRGLGLHAQPLWDVEKNLPQNQPAQNPVNTGTAIGTSVMGTATNAGVASNGLREELADNILITSLAGRLGLQNQPAQNPVNTGTAIGTSVMGTATNAGVASNGLREELADNILITSLAGRLGLQAVGLMGLGALQNQLLQQGLTASDLTTLLTAQANVNQANLGLGATDLRSSMLVSNALSDNVLAGNSMSSGPMSANSYGGQSRQMSAPKEQGYGCDAPAQQTRYKVSNMVVVTNLPPTVTSHLIREKFSECGEIKFMEMTAPDTAIVRFLKEWDAERAIKMFDRSRIDGRIIGVRSS